VVQEYGLLHGCILELADHAGLTISNRDQATVAKWLNAGISDALSQYVRQRDLELQREASRHLGFIAHELRNPLAVARLAFLRLRQTELRAGGRTVDMLDRNLRRTTEMIEDTLTHSSLKVGVVPRLEPMRLGPFLRDLEEDAGIEAQARRIALSVSAPEDLVVEADPQLLRSALANLIFNALKFSREGSTVAIETRATEDRVVLEVADACGGLPPGKAEELFQPFVQRGEDRTGFGLGLAIARQAVEAHHGSLTVRDVPGKGCVFSITLPLGAPS
jgi:signal transduction histidine kinase